MAGTPVCGSFRDPCGCVIRRDGTIFRLVHPVYFDEYRHLMDSGLYNTLVDEGLLIRHEEVGMETQSDLTESLVIRPEKVPFISYPYEWSFSQMKDAALLSLRIQRTAMEHGMSLKDCSAYNVQFHKGRPVFIDTLSFERYKDGGPWVAYRQFCQHFLAPLALMSMRDVRLGKLARLYIDGIQLDLASSLLPFRSKLNLGLLMHIHMHAGFQGKYDGRQVDKAKQRAMPRQAVLNLVSHLESTVRGLSWSAGGTEWADYYDDTNYSQEGFSHKRSIVKGYLERIGPESVWDMGANNGSFSMLASEMGVPAVAFDIDPAAVELNYRESVKRGDVFMLPLLLDLTNPSPALGWANSERSSILERGPADCVMALALIHHLAIGNNLPFGHIAEFMARCGRHLIIEFVPKSDSQVQRLLVVREDIFGDYSIPAFEEEFSGYFDIVETAGIKDSERVLYLMKCRE